MRHILVEKLAMIALKIYASRQMFTLVYVSHLQPLLNKTKKPF